MFIKTKNKTFIKNLQSDKSGNDLLMKHILDFFTDNNLNFNDISEIYVNQGPGNFSGLRGSLAVAKGMSLTRKLKLFGYDTFIWSCANASEKKNYFFSLIKIREKYFIKKFDKNLKSISKAEEIKIEDIKKNYDDKFKVIPKNLAKYYDKEILSLNNLNVVDLNHQVLGSLQAKGLLNQDFIRPLYFS